MPGCPVRRVLPRTQRPEPGVRVRPLACRPGACDSVCQVKPSMLGARKRQGFIRVLRIAYPSVVQCQPGDRTFNLAFGTTFEYGRHAKFPGEPVAGFGLMLSPVNPQLRPQATGNGSSARGRVARCRPTSHSRQGVRDGQHHSQYDHSAEASRDELARGGHLEENLDQRQVEDVDRIAISAQGTQPASGQRSPQRRALSCGYRERAGRDDRCRATEHAQACESIAAIERGGWK